MRLAAGRNRGTKATATVRLGSFGRSRGRRSQGGTMGAAISRFASCSETGGILKTSGLWTAKPMVVEARSGYTGEKRGTAGSCPELMDASRNPCSCLQDARIPLPRGGTAPLPHVSGLPRVRDVIPLARSLPGLVTRIKSIPSAYMLYSVQHPLYSVSCRGFV
jgi:hypothetical protein